MIKLPLVRIPAQSAIHRLGASANPPRAQSLLRFEKGWTITPAGAASQGKAAGPTQCKVEGWAVVGDGEGRRLVVETLLSRHRIHPLVDPPGAFPLINQLKTAPRSSEDPFEVVAPVRHLAFSRPPSPSGDFSDFTARYGHLLESDKQTLVESLSELSPKPTQKQIEQTCRTMKIEHLLKLPLISLSSGQTRRARIAAALLTQPSLLLLEDPLAGLDVGSRKEVAALLGKVNAEGIRLVLVLRGKGKGKEAALPNWVTDVVHVQQGEVWIGPKGEYAAQHVVAREQGVKDGKTDSSVREAMLAKRRHLEPVVEMDEISVSYGVKKEREVLKNVSWTIKPGDKWHLQGANGSGKTTLLSLLLGQHPRSYSLPPTSLTLFSKPRREIPTPTLRTMIGHTSPEIYQAFPRGMGLTALESILSGFWGVFCRRQESTEQRRRAIELFEFFEKDFGRLGYETPFGRFPPNQQALILFLRAVVARPRVLVLDEPAQGMDEVIWDRCRLLLEKEWEAMPEQAVVVVSHYDDEVPWSKAQGLVLKLQDGVVVEDTSD